MKTGYKELIDNNSFHIDNMDNISLDNIDYEDDIEDEPNDE
jgi:DNA-dependent RNA polymerase auxiliary subunit epsilon